ncbi:MAG TPA: asparagine synthase (glutamine-hydrolyzing) [Patescibacteria group bacterium]|nr:asparagine synthase (glutamine-hydrolyzing) [Patescibacteria group bacterium]
MSGIAGYLGIPQELAVLQSMVRKLYHRGPDGEGFHIEPPVFMGQRRLATIDPDEQWLPLYSEDRKFAIAFAGELYNYREERAKLEQKGLTFRTQTDTEVALNLYRAYGVNCVNHMRGHFAFAVHDMQKDLVFIARDPMGVQPLYYTTTQSGSFVFASEIKALLEHPSVRATPDLMGVDAFLTLGYTPGEGGIFKGVHMLPPGHRLIWNPGLHVAIEPYWQWDSYATPDSGLKTDADFQARFNELFDEAVAIRQLPDVSLGAFATGSLESAAILSSMAKNSTAPLKVFTGVIGNEMDGMPSAGEIASRVGATAQAIQFEPEYMDRLPELVWALDQPVADPNILTMHLMSRLAASKVKVAMSGLGANNLFLNYPQHDTLLAAHDMPKLLWKAFKGGQGYLPLATIARRLRFAGRIGPRQKQRLSDLAEAMRGGSLHQQYMSVAALISARDRQQLYAPALAPLQGAFADRDRQRQSWPSVMAELMGMQRDHLLQDSVLSPIDKISRFNSLGTRLPLMDHKLFGFMLGVPDHLRRGQDKRKLLLRNYVEKALPGITSPATPMLPAPVGKRMMDECLARGPLRDMVDICLSEASLRRRGLFEPEAARQMVTAAKAGGAWSQKQVFALLMVELWFRIFIDHEKGWISH